MESFSLFEPTTNLTFDTNSINVGNKNQPSWNIVIGSPTADNTLYAPFSSFTASNIFNSIVYTQKSEVFLIEAVRNLLRKLNLTDLNEMLNTGELTSEEYELALDKEENKFVITLKNINSRDDAKIIAELVEKIGHDLRIFSTSDVAEMFSVKESQLIAHLNDCKKILR